MSMAATRPARDEERGKIVRWVEDRGFGFIAPLRSKAAANRGGDRRQPDVFVHTSAVDWEALAVAGVDGSPVGTVVTFRTEQSRKGLRAVGVRPAPKADAKQGGLAMAETASADGCDQATTAQRRRVYTREMKVFSRPILTGVRTAPKWATLVSKAKVSVVTCGPDAKALDRVFIEIRDRAPPEAVNDENAAASAAGPSSSAGGEAGGAIQAVVELGDGGGSRHPAVEPTMRSAAEVQLAGQAPERLELHTADVADILDHIEAVERRIALAHSDDGGGGSGSNTDGAVSPELSSGSSSASGSGGESNGKSRRRGRQRRSRHGWQSRAFSGVTLVTGGGSVTQGVDVVVVSRPGTADPLCLRVIQPEDGRVLAAIGLEGPHRGSGSGDGSDQEESEGKQPRSTWPVLVSGDGDDATSVLRIDYLSKVEYIFASRAADERARVTDAKQLAKAIRDWQHLLGRSKQRAVTSREEMAAAAARKAARQSQVLDPALFRGNRKELKAKTRRSGRLNASVTVADIADLVSTLAAAAEAQDKAGPPPDLSPPTLNVSLYRHQRAGLAWLVDAEASPRAGGILADDMGLGKTLQMLCLSVRDNGEGADSDDEASSSASAEAEAGTATLVVCPLALMRNWIKEGQSRFSNEAPHAMREHHGSNRYGSAADIRPHHIVVTTYETLRGDTVLRQHKWRRVVLDEGHRIGNIRAQTTEAVLGLEADKRWVVTGTPLQNSLADLMAMFVFLRVAPYDTEAAFRSQVLKVPQAVAVQRLASILSVLVLRRNKDALERRLPPKRIVWHEVALSRRERAFYAAAQSKAQEALRAGGNALTHSIRLMQACTDPRLLPASYLEEVLAAMPNPEAGRAETEADALADIMSGLTIGDGTAPTGGSGKAGGGKAGGGKAGGGKARRGDEDSGSSSLGSSSPASSAHSHSSSSSGSHSSSAASASSSGSASPSPTRSEAPRSTLGTAGGSDPSWPPADRPASKIRRATDILASILEGSADEKALVFSSYTRTLDLMEDEFAALGWTAVRLDGSSRKEERTAAVEALNTDPSVRLMLISLKAGGVGLTLTAANHVMMLDLAWNPAVEAQAADRVHRIGQERPVTIHRLIVPDTIEDRLRELQDRKRGLAAAVVGGNGGESGSRGESGGGEGSSSAGGKPSRDDLMRLFGLL